MMATKAHITKRLYEAQRQGFLTDFRLTWSEPLPRGSEDEASVANNHAILDGAASARKDVLNKNDAKGRFRLKPGGKGRGRLPRAQVRELKSNAGSRESTERSWPERDPPIMKNANARRLLSIHKLILAAASRHFRDMLQADCTVDEYDIPFGVTGDVVDAMVAHIYGQPTADLSDSDKKELNKAMTFFGIAADDEDGEEMSTSETTPSHPIDANKLHTRNFENATGEAQFHIQIAHRESRSMETGREDNLAVEPDNEADCRARFRKMWQKCEICGKVLKKTLARHMQQVHSDERPHPCLCCGKSFKTGSDLKRHKEKVHDKIKKPSKPAVMCQQCGKYFLHLGDLKHHQRAVHQRLRPFQCSICPHSAGSRGDLNRHVVLRHKYKGVKPFKCSYCSHSSAQLSNCQKHIRLMHAGEKVNVVHLGYPDVEPSSHVRQSREPKSHHKVSVDFPKSRTRESNGREAVNLNDDAEIRSTRVPPVGTSISPISESGDANSSIRRTPVSRRAGGLINGQIGLNRPDESTLEVVQEKGSSEKNRAERVDGGGGGATGLKVPTGGTPRANPESAISISSLPSLRREAVESGKGLRDAVANNVADESETPAETLLSLSIQGRNKTLEITNYSGRDVLPLHFEEANPKPAIANREIGGHSHRASDIEFPVARISSSPAAETGRAYAIVDSKPQQAAWQPLEIQSRSTLHLRSLPVINLSPGHLARDQLNSAVPSTTHVLGISSELPAHLDCRVPEQQTDGIQLQKEIRHAEEAKGELIQSVIPIQTSDGRQFIALPSGLSDGHNLSYFVAQQPCIPCTPSSESLTLSHTDQNLHDATEFVYGVLEGVVFKAAGHARTVEVAKPCSSSHNIRGNDKGPGGSGTSNNLLYDLAQHASLQQRIPRNLESTEKVEAEQATSVGSLS